MVLLASLLPAGAAFAQTLPLIRSATTTRTLYIGERYDPANPAEAPYVGYPSHSNAPKITLTIPQLAAELDKKTSTRGVLTETVPASGIWVLKWNLELEQDVKLEISTASGVSELRLESMMVGDSKVHNKIVADGGQVLIKGVENGAKLKVTSWDTTAGAVDTDTSKPRSYIAILNGGRMDILDAEMAYLGWREANPRFNNAIGKGEPSGLAWKRRASPELPETGPTGSIIRSLIHHNYYGMYTWQAYDMVLTDNKVYANGYYGFDPHDYSEGFIVSGNEFYENGGHGFIISRGCVNYKIFNNKSYRNHKHGMMLDRGSNYNEVYNNEIYENGEDGFAIFESKYNNIYNNIIRDNERHGLRVNAVYDEGDTFDDLATDNIFRNNTIMGNKQNGVFLYERADRNRFENNTVSNNKSYGFNLEAGMTMLISNTISNNLLDGILIAGGPLWSYQPGVSPITPAIVRPGHGNIMLGNLIEGNGAGNAGVSEGIQIKRGTANIISQSIIRNNNADGILITDNSSGNQITQNTIRKNKRNGVYINSSTSKQNLISQNSILENDARGVQITNGNNRIKEPIIGGTIGNVVTGTAPANARVEVYRDQDGEGAVYKGSATANAAGAWSFTLPAGDNPSQGALTALAIDARDNTSQFSVITGTLQAASVDQPITFDESDAIEATMRAEALAAARDDQQVPDDDGTITSLSAVDESELEVIHPGSADNNNNADMRLRYFLPFVQR
jgi:parallel beta-helix repeat protein